MNIKCTASFPKCLKYYAKFSDMRFKYILMIEGKVGLDVSSMFEIELIIHYRGKVLSILLTLCGSDDCDNLIVQ